MRTARSLPYLVGSLSEGVSLTETPPGQKPHQTETHLWSEKHLWKHNLRKLRLRAVIMKFR